ncbi:MAG: glycosyltransferase family 87 protein [Sphingomonadales bacterium]
MSADESMRLAAIPPAGDRVRLLLVTAALLLACFVPYYLLTLDLQWPIPRDGTTLVVGRDFLNFWMYGRAAWEADPAHYYDLAAYWRATEAVTGSPYPHQLWSYPPSVMLLAAPFAAFPYLPALALWTLVGLGCFAAALRLWTRQRRLLFPLLFAPAAVFGLMSGQFALIAAAAILAVLRWRESRPLLAGVLLGLLTVKPQLGLFFPVMLLAARSWRVIAAAALTAAAVAGATALFWGVGVWEAYLHSGLANQSLVLTDPQKLGGQFMPTIFMNARLLGAPFGAAMAVQAIAAIAAALLVWLVFSRRPPAGDLRANAIFLCASVFGTPYLLSYDTLALGVLSALLFVRAGEGRLLPLLAYLLPLLQLVGLPGPALVPLLLAAQLFGTRRSSLPSPTSRNGAPPG